LVKRTGVSASPGLVLLFIAFIAASGYADRGSLVLAFFVFLSANLLMEDSLEL